MKKDSGTFAAGGTVALSTAMTHLLQREADLSHNISTVWLGQNVGTELCCNQNLTETKTIQAWVSPGGQVEAGWRPGGVQVEDGWRSHYTCTGNTHVHKWISSSWPGVSDLFDYTAAACVRQPVGGVWGCEGEMFPQQRMMDVGETVMPRGCRGETSRRVWSSV